MGHLNVGSVGTLIPNDESSYSWWYCSLSMLVGLRSGFGLMLGAMSIGIMTLSVEERGRVEGRTVVLS